MKGLQKRKLGQQGLEVSCLGLGCMGAMGLVPASLALYRPQLNIVWCRVTNDGQARSLVG